MGIVKCILGTVVLFTFYTWTDAVALRNSTEEKQELNMSEKLELDNNNLDEDAASGDGESAAFSRVWRNADPSVNRSCKWPMSSDGKVYVPYVVDDKYPLLAAHIFLSGMGLISQPTCIRFTPRTNELHYLHFQPLNDSSSFVGRQGGAQTPQRKYLSCLRSGRIELELVLTLGFHRKQTWWYTDHQGQFHVTDNWETIQDYMDTRFDGDKLGTPYDYNSTEHSGRYDSSENEEPSLRASNPVNCGTSTEISKKDIEQVHRLCCVDSPYFYTLHKYFG